MLALIYAALFVSTVHAACSPPPPQELFGHASHTLRLSPTTHWDRCGMSPDNTSFCLPNSIISPDDLHFDPNWGDTYIITAATISPDPPVILETATITLEGRLLKPITVSNRFPCVVVISRRSSSLPFSSKTLSYISFCVARVGCHSLECSRFARTRMGACITCLSEFIRPLNVTNVD